MQCVILAGGLGTRMRPFTEALPKALIPVNGIPFVDHQLRWLAGHGVTEVILCVGYRGGQIRDYVQDGSRLGLPVRYVDEGQDLRGTAGALRLALAEGVLDEKFLVTYGDSYLPIDFRELWRAFMGQDRPAMMAVYRNQGRWDTSNVLLKSGRAFYDKRRRDPTQAERMEHIDYGVSALARSVVAERIPAQGPADLADILHGLSMEGRLAAHEVKARFYEVGSVEGLRDLEQFLLHWSSGR